MKTFLHSAFNALLASCAIVGASYLLLDLIANDDWIELYSTLIFTHAIYWILVPPIVWGAWNRDPQSFFRSPNVRSVIEDKLLLVDAEAWLSINTSVAIFQVEDDFERLIAIGKVVNIQSNGLAQILCERPSSHIDAQLELKDKKKLLIIKPGMALT